MSPEDQKRMDDFFNSHEYDKTGDWRKTPETDVDPDDEPDGKTTDAPKKKAAGLAFFDQGGHLLLLKRGQDCDHAGTWALPAGGIEPGEDPAFTAKRELEEETGYRLTSDQDPQLIERWVNGDGVDFTLFRVDGRRFSPTLNHEHIGWKWLKPGAPESKGLPMHPDLGRCTRALGMPAL